MPVLVRGFSYTPDAIFNEKFLTSPLAASD